MTRRLAAFALDRAHDAIPAAIDHAVRRALLDHAGVALAGTRHPAFGKLTAMLRELGVSGPCRVLGTSLRCDAVNAALANGTAAHLHDWDDTVLPARIHLGATLFPPLLAAGTSRGWSLAQIVPAVAIGFELQARISRAIYPAIHHRRWHSTSLVASIGAAAAIGRLLGCGELQMGHALGIAANGAAGLMSSFGTMTKALNVGRAGAWGLQSALLAAGGFEAHPDTLGDGRFLEMFDDEPRMAILSDGLGADWSIAENGFKPYPCGFVAHAAIDAVRRLRSEAGPAAVLARLELTVAPEAVQLMGRKAPRNELDAKFSLAYAAAVAWVEGHVTPAAFQAAVIADPRVRAVMDVMAVEASPRMAQTAATARAVMSDGQELTAAVVTTRGTPELPLSDDDLVEKFELAYEMAGRTAGTGVARQLLQGEGLTAAETMDLLA